MGIAGVLLHRPGGAAPAPATAPGAPATAASSPATAPATRPAHAPPGARVTSEGWFAPPAPKPEPKPPLPSKIERAFVIPIHGPITMTTYDTVKRKALRCRNKERAQLVIFDMNTPGGRSDAMGKIAQVITSDLGGIYTMAYVHPEAISAGAIISLACDEIVLSPGARIGDAMPIMIGPQGTLVPIPKEERGKIESYARSQVRNLAERNGYNVDLCEAMITLRIEIWLIRNRRTRELRYLNLEKHPNYAAPKSDDEGRGAAKPRLDEPWEYVRRIDGPLELVTMTTREALDLGFATEVFADLDELAAHYTVIERPTVLEDTWSETLVEFLTSPVVTAILMFVLILGIYVELNTPGVGLPGAVALIALAVLLSSRYLTGLAQWWEIALFIVGLVLLAIEIFVTPGFGVMGVSGAICCLVALLAIIVPNPPDKLPLPSTEIGWGIFRAGLAAVAIGFLAAIAAAALLAKFLPDMPVANRLILTPTVLRSPGLKEREAWIGSIRVGQIGTIEGICRPVGQVRFGEKLVDAIADGGFLPSGTRVKVVKNEGNRVVVTAVDA